MNTLKIKTHTYKEIATIYPTDESYFYDELMGETYLYVKFSLKNYLDLKHGYSVFYKDKDFFVYEKPIVRKINSENYEYSVKFSDAKHVLSMFIFDLNDILYPASNFSYDALSFDITEKPSKLIEYIVNCANAKLHYNNYEEVGFWGIEFVVGDITIADDSEKHFEFHGATLADALNSIAEVLNTEWSVESNYFSQRLNLGRVEKNISTPTELSYGRGNGLKSGLTKQQTTMKNFTHLFCVGSDRNIDTIKYGSKKLHFPIEVFKQFNKQLYDNETPPIAVAFAIGYDGKNFNFIPCTNTYNGDDWIGDVERADFVDNYWLDLVDNNGEITSKRDKSVRYFYVETTPMFALIECDASFSQGSTPTITIKKRPLPLCPQDAFVEFSETYPSVQFEVYTHYLYGELDAIIYKPQFFNFIPIPGQRLQVRFESGKLMGLEFDLTELGVWDAGTVIEWYNGYSGFYFEKDKSPYYDEDNPDPNLVIPNATIRPAAGDKFALFNMRVMPEEFLYNVEIGAEFKLLRQAVQYFYENTNKDSTYRFELDEIWCVKHATEASKLQVGSHVKITDNEFLFDETKRIKSVKQTINNPHYSPIITCEEL